MPTLEEIGASVKAFGDKAVASAEALTKTFNETRVALEALFEKNEKRIDDLSSQMRDRPPGSGGRNTSDEVDLKKFSLSKAVLAQLAVQKGVADPWAKHDAGYERDVSKQLYSDMVKSKMPEIAEDSLFVPTRLFDRSIKTASSVMNEPLGGFFVNTQFLPGVIPVLRPNNASFALPVTTYTGLVGSPAKMPRVSADATGYWVAETGAMTGSNPVVEQMAMFPKKLGAQVQLTRDLLMFAPGTAESVTRDSIMFAMENTIDVAFWQGTGASGQPKGLSSWAGNTKSFSGATDITYWTTLDQMIMENEADNGPVDGAVWVMHPRVWHKLTQVQLPQAMLATSSSAGTAQVGGPVLTGGNYAQGIPRLLKGYPVYLTTNITASTTSTIFFFKPQEAIRGRWGATELRVTDQGTTLQTSDLVQINGWDRVDHQVVHANSICTGTAFTY